MRHCFSPGDQVIRNASDGRRVKNYLSTLKPVNGNNVRIDRLESGLSKFRQNLGLKIDSRGVEIVDVITESNQIQYR